MDPEPGGSNTEHIYLSRRTLLEYYRDCSSQNPSEKFNNLVDKVQNVLQNQDVLSKQLLSKFIYEYKQKWTKAKRNERYFNQKEKNWLDSYVAFPINCDTQSSGGRPTVPFSQSSERSKRRKTELLRSTVDTDVLAYATQMKLRAEGKHVTATLVKESLESDELTHSYTRYTPDEALALVVGAKLSKHQYNFIRQSAIAHNCNMYPSYEAITESKKKCYPHNLLVTESSASIPLQNLLNHTAYRIIQAHSDLFTSLSEYEMQNLCMITKWGCDGTSGQSQYMQIFQDKTISDQSIFSIAIAPIQIACGNPEDEDKPVLWKTPTASSPRYCRPLKIFFAKETTELIKQETDFVNTQIETLTPTEIEYENKRFTVKHKLILSMIDGKTAHAISETASYKRCYICGLTTKSFNNIPVCLNKPESKEQYLELGASILHAWIRFFECLLHISYKLPICKWETRNQEDKVKIENKKKEVQESFRRKLGLIVDKPKPGYGSTNTGNTARTFFRNFGESAEITGVQKNLIYRFYIILLALSSSTETIDTEKFKLYCLKTAAVFVKNYPWYKMPTTVHKILIHGHKIIEHAIVPLGCLSEEAQESRNKDIKNYREFFSRKMSRVKTMEDVVHNLLISSDPYITNLTTRDKKKIRPYEDYPKELKDLLL